MEAETAAAAEEGGGRVERKAKRNSLVVKVGMVGDAQIGKTSLMVKYVEGKFDSDYIETLGVNFMEKSIALKNAEVTFSIWDLGGEREFISMLPLVCNDAIVILFMFDLSRRSTLTSVKEWYRQVRGLNKQAFAFLIGTKYDIFATLPHEEQKEITKQARKFARAMKAPLIFSSSSHSINVQKVFKLIFGKVFDVDCKVPIVTKVGDPIIEYTTTANASNGGAGAGALKSAEADDADDTNPTSTANDKDTNAKSAEEPDKAPADAPAAAPAAAAAASAAATTAT